MLFQVCRTTTVTTVENIPQGPPMRLARFRGLDYQTTFCARHPAPTVLTRLPVVHVSVVRSCSTIGAGAGCRAGANVLV